MTRSVRPNVALGRRPPLDKDFFIIAEKINKALTDRVTDSLTSLVGDYAKVLKGSLETAATYLYIKAIDSKKGSVYHEAMLDLLKLLGIVIGHTTNTISLSPRSLIYRFVLGELNKLTSPEDLTIITFNYDMLLERVLDEISLRGHSDIFHFPGCYRFDGLTRAQKVTGLSQFPVKSFEHSGVSLFKLHGSLNWQSVHTSTSPTPSAMFNPNRELHILDSPLVQGGLTWRRKAKLMYMNPVIVPPVSGKRGMIHSNMLPLWVKAGKALSSADRVVITGYSCPPLDLEARILLSENLRSNDNKKIYVIDPDPKTASKFVDLCGVGHITMYTSIKDWVQDAVS